jgi:hypothetical protein
LVGLRFEWQDEGGQWKSLWNQAETIYEGLKWDQEYIDKLSPTHRDAYDHALPVYQRARAIYDTLKQVEYPEDADLFPWIKIGPPIVVKMITYDHLERTISITDQVPTRLEAPRLRSFKENTFMLLKLYGSNNKQDLFIGDPPASQGPNHRTFGGGRPIGGLKFCVICQKPGRTYAEHIDRLAYCPTKPAVTDGPEEDQRRGTCHRCYMLRRPCAWVIPPLLAANNGPGERFQFIRTPPADSRGAQNITGPSEVLAAGPTLDEEGYEDAEQSLESGSEVSPSKRSGNSDSADGQLVNSLDMVLLPASMFDDIELGKGLMPGIYEQFEWWKD